MLRHYLGVTRRCSIVSLGFLLVLTVASAIFVYLVSPLRNPAFQPDSANAGTLVWWLQGVREADWLWGAFILAGLLAINFMLVLWSWCRSRSILAGDWHQEMPNKIAQLMLFGIGAWFFLYCVFLFYLLGQWLVD